MKEQVGKKGSKQIICIIVMIMLFNFIVPNYTYAKTETDGGGKLFDPIIKFTTFLCDSLMQFMQNSFTSNQSIDNGDGTYNFQYSPAIIFSGNVLGLDINFITPNTDVRNTNNYEAFLRKKEDTYYKETQNDGKTNKTEKEYKELLNQAKKHEGRKIITNLSHFSYIYSGEAEIIYYEEIRKEDNEERNFLCVEYFVKTKGSGMGALNKGHHYKKYEYELTPKFLEEMNATATYNSIANELQPTIATWYNALRRIALVGLLSVLVYLGIRIVLSSSSPEGNSKYKKMLTDWLIALCLLFTLHYIMSATLVITQKLSSIFTLGATDELLNTLRQEIDGSKTWGTALSQVIMYVVLVIFTGVFTFQYLKRVLYMAFFTMIAPLITLTYPIDKVNDGKAQAFSMWIKEYVFNALIQVVHLIIYFTLVESAMALVESFPLYGIIAIGFMTQAEKIIRNMFGFNNAETIGTMGAVAAGGLITSAMNKLKSLPSGAKGGKKGKSGGDSGTGGSSKSNVRTATNNPLGALQGGTGRGSSDVGAGTTSTGSSGAGGASPSTSGNSTSNRSISGGAKSLGKKYYKPVAKGVLGAGLGVGAGLTGAMIGFAAGVAQGDVGAALTGAAVGGTAGMNLGKGAVNLPGNIGKGVKSGWNNLKDTYREGEYGEERYKAIKTVAQNCPDEIYNNKEMLEEFWRKTMGEEESAENIKEILRKFK